tara:strand:+ start:500 stop:739 length:240 start_codon:yes stop_codon:yes gene_type:complete
VVELDDKILERVEDLDDLVKAYADIASSNPMPEGEEQGRLLKMLDNRIDLKAGDTFFLLENKWWSHWKGYAKVCHHRRL